MGATDLIKKLRIQAGQRALILNAPEGYINRLGRAPRRCHCEPGCRRGIRFRAALRKEHR